MWETWVQSLGREDPLEKEMATHSSILAWRIPWTEELGGLQSTGRKESDTTEQLHFLSLSLFTQRKPLEYKTWHHPTTNSTLLRMPHLNNKEKKNINPIIIRQEYHLTQPCPSEEKQTNKNSAQISPYTKLTQTTGPTLEGWKPKGRKNSTLKPVKKRPQTQ